MAIFNRILQDQLCQEKNKDKGNRCELGVQTEFNMSNDVACETNRIQVVSTAMQTAFDALKVP